MADRVVGDNPIPITLVQGCGTSQAQAPLTYALITLFSQYQAGANDTVFGACDLPAYHMLFAADETSIPALSSAHRLDRVVQADGNPALGTMVLHYGANHCLVGGRQCRSVRQEQVSR